MPTPVRAEPTTTGNSGALEHLVGQRALELVDGRHLARQVALQLLVVARDDLLDQLVVDAVLLVGEVGRAWARVWCLPSGSYSKA